VIKFWNSSASGSGSRNFLKDSSALRYRAFSHNLACISEESERILMKILSQMYPWSRKSPLYLGSNLVPESGSEVHIWIHTVDPDHILLGGHMRSLTALVT